MPVADLRSVTRTTLLGTPIRDLGGTAHRWSGVEIRDLIITVERKDAGLCPAIEIRECASLDMNSEDMSRLIDGVGAKISDGSLHNCLVLLRSACHPIIGGEFR